MIELNQKYDRGQLLSFLKEAFLNDFQKDIRPVDAGNLSAINKAYALGSSPSLDLQVFEFEYTGSFNKRIALAKEAFQVMKHSATFQALAVFYSPENDDWRFSLMTANPQRNDKGNIAVTFSNPRRYSFFLGPNAKVNTPTKFLIKKGIVVDFNDLKSRFSLEVVNKEFYKEISESFTKLVGGTRGEGRSKTTYESLLKLPSVNDHSQTSIEFGVRLIGRLIFCWFLREKVSKSGSPLMPKELLSLDAISKNTDYYHKILEPIFFEVLNRPIKMRKDPYSLEPFSLTPYLNGGLFSPHDDDFFSSNEDRQASYHNIVTIPDKWLMEFFGILETYNFTIDENTSIDEELSIDPEMLGRIFENLLAEINPETGESARKNTGSYYTPRIIVDYMVDESLLLYLRGKTQIEEEKLRAIISYDLSDDLSFPLNEDEKKDLIDAIEKVKILDPACGSGAYPIGALQKIVFILQQIDPDGQIWFQKQIQHTSPEIKRVIEREFSYKNFDYIRKLGIIRENIYGIDIQPIATEISRLRCFLTLVVDERIDDSLENRGVEPLPNLDFKFVTANSLLSLPTSDKKNQMGLFEDTDGIKELREIRDMFFNAYGAEREQLKLQFVQAQNRMFQRLISENRRGHAELTTMLTTWNPFSHTASLWFDSEWMFGIKDGFDIVIANPPYSTLSRVTGTSNKDSASDQNLKKVLLTLFPNSAEYKILLYTLFIDKGISLIKDGGNLSYITPDSFLIGRFSSKIRKHILNSCNINKIILIKEDFWESGVVGFPTITFLNKVEDKERKLNEVSAIRVDHLSDFNTKSYQSFSYRQSYFNEQAYNRFRLFFNAEDLSLVNKVEENSIQLGDISSIHVGVRPKVGYQEIQSSEKINSKWHRGLVKGNEISQYLVRWDGNYINIDPEKLWAGGFNPEIVNKEKLLIRKTGDSLIVALDLEKLFHLDIIHALIVKDDHYDLRYIMSILNSKAINYYYKTTTLSSGRVMPQVNIETVEKIPIKKISLEEQSKFIEIVNNILETDRGKNKVDNDNSESLIEQYKTDIDKLVYELYGLTKDEIKIVESSND